MNPQTLSVDITNIISFPSHFVCCFSATSKLAFSDLLQHHSENFTNNSWKKKVLLR